MVVWQQVLVTLSLGAIFISLGVTRVLLIKFSANHEGQYDYLPVTVNVCAEFIKLTVCGVLAVKVLISKPKKDCRNVCCYSWAEVVQLMKWSVPGFLYFCDNLLAFYVIKYLQPAFAVLLGNFVIITTSLLYRFILRRKFSNVQWASLVVLLLSIVTLSHQSHSSDDIAVDHHRHHAINHLVPSNVSSLNPCEPSLAAFSQVSNITEPHSKWSGPIKYFKLNEGHLLIMLQCFLSSLANVYNEKIFKENSGLQESIYVQNSKLYFFGVIFNMLSLVTHDGYRHKMWACGFFYGHNKYSVSLMFVTAMYGLSVAFILKFRDNMFHLMSSQIITVSVITASVFFFQFWPDLEFFLVAPIVLLVIYIFQVSWLPQATKAKGATVMSLRSAFRTTVDGNITHDTQETELLMRDDAD